MRRTKDRGSLPEFRVREKLAEFGGVYSGNPLPQEANTLDHEEIARLPVFGIAPRLTEYTIESRDLIHLLSELRPLLLDEMMRPSSFVIRYSAEFLPVPYREQLGQVIRGERQVSYSFNVAQLIFPRKSGRVKK